VRRRRHGPAAHRGGHDDARGRHLRADAPGAVGAVAPRGRAYDVGRASRRAVPPLRPARVRARRLPLPDAAHAGGGDRRRGRGPVVTQAAVRVKADAGWLGWFDTTPALPTGSLERAACLALLAFAAVLQLSIAAADILLTIATILWVGLLVRNKERFEVPRMFWPLAAYAAATVVPSLFSVGPRLRLIASRQLVLLVIVPRTYRLLRGRRALLGVDIIITVGALSATWGIVQYLILNFDHLGRRPEGVLGHYMTYSGLLMLVACAAVSRVMFAKH